MSEVTIVENDATPDTTGVLLEGARANKVTLFEDRAEVLRVGRVDLQPGLHWVGLCGVTPFVVDRSVQARADVASGGEAIVVTARVHRVIRLDPVLSSSETEELEREARAAQAQLKKAQTELERYAGRRQRLHQLEKEWIDTFSTVPTGLSDDVTHWKETWQDIVQTRRQASQQWYGARERSQDADTTRRHAKERLARGLVKRPRCQARIEVLVDVAKAGSFDVSATYRTPCAVWRPSYITRLGEPDESGNRELTVELFGTVWQMTGETWDDLVVELSTARPTAASRAPLLDDDVLYKRKKTAEERREIDVDVREQAIAVAGLGAAGDRADGLPGVDDGGTPLTFEGRTTMSLASDGQPHQVPIKVMSLAADATVVICPELGDVAHLVARSAASQGPILAGPAWLGRGSGLLGLSQLEYVADGDKFEVGFGPVDALRSRRRVEERRDTTLVTGTQKVDREVTVFLSNTSGDTHVLEVRERIPVSEIDAVTVEIVDAAGWDFDQRHGILSRKIKLGPREHTTLRYDYALRAASSVRLPF